MAETRNKFIRPNLLGDLRAEADLKLSEAFLETGDYRTLIETSDRIIVVGRRGTGKSAITIQLEKYWSSSENTAVIKIAPEEHQIIGIRPLVKLFGESFRLMRAGSRLAWRYALMLETASRLSSHYKFKKLQGTKILEEELQLWRSLHLAITNKLRVKLEQVIDKSKEPETRISDLSVLLKLDALEEALSQACLELNVVVVFLIDKLDEGYEPDNIGIGFIDGLIQAAIDIKTRMSGIKPIIFLRDNIFRAVQYHDPDYTRNIEGHVLRLHWDQRGLLDFIAKRLQLALKIEGESSLKIWNKCTVNGLKGEAGFNKCLHLTLYRPRDLLALLNEAFYNAGKNGQEQILEENIESTAKTISQNRLDDLIKEYTATLPSLREYIGAFHGKDPQLELKDAVRIIEVVISAGSQDSLVQQDFIILENAESVIRGLYSVGFLGVREPTSGSFVFCHDGRAPDRDFSLGDQVIVHPCYWSALNCNRNSLSISETEEIFDEYDIEVISETPKIRKIKIQSLMNELKNIPEGVDGAERFEHWCHKAIRICFAKGLRNVELKPNKLAKSRRDVVATNLGDVGVWERIYNDYGTRQLIFEIKNYEGLNASDYQQIQSYLSGEYGRFALVVNRDASTDLYAQKDVEWVREMYSTHKVLIVKLTGNFFVWLLEKLSNPRKHDYVDDSLHRLLDTYTRLYIGGQTKADEQSRKKKAKRKNN